MNDDPNLPQVVDYPPGMAAKHREHLVRFGFNPDCTQSEYAQDYLSRPEPERQKIARAWHAILREFGQAEISS